MLFEEELESNADRLRTIYDLAAFCYDYIVTNVDDQGLFIGKYLLKSEKSNTENPNLPQLGWLNMQVEQQLLKSDSDEEHIALPFGKTIQKIQQIVKKMENILEEYGEEKENRATIPLHVLLAIDRYFTESRKLHPERTPGNRAYCEKSYIYLAPRHNISDEMTEKLDFPKEIEPPFIRMLLHNLIILERSGKEEQEPPQVVQLWISPYDEMRRQLLKKQKLKIAIIPLEKAHMTMFPAVEGGTFRVEYTEWHKQNVTTIALRLLDMAIKQGANIIVFPEFVCSPSLQKDIQNHLQKIDKQRPDFAKKLLFVVAGSGWTEDDNNVSSIFSYNGRLLGRQYKQQRFWKTDNGEVGLLEGLRNPGKKSTICEVEQIGQIMFAICRDVSDRSRTREMARIFHPQFLLVPAWSTSIHNGFEAQFGEIIQQNHRTCSVVCNCCEAYGTEMENRDLNGIITIPYKDKSIITGKTYQLMRNEECWKDGPCGGCIFMADFDFRPKKEKTLRVIKKIKQNKP